MERRALMFVDVLLVFSEYRRSSSFFDAIFSGMVSILTTRIEVDCFVSFLSCFLGWMGVLTLQSLQTCWRLLNAAKSIDFCCSLNEYRPSEHPPVRGKTVKTFRWDHRLQRQNLFMGFKRLVPPW